MRICVVGCGAVGSLFAANLATLDDVEVWAFDLARDHVDAINRDGLRLDRRRRRRRAACARRRTRPSCRRATSGSSRPRRCTPSARSPRPRTRSRTGAVATVQNGIGNEEVLAAARRARDSRHDVPGREGRRAGRRAVGREGRHDARPVRGRSPAAQSPRSSGSPTPARAPGCRRRAVADARGPQWRKVIFNAATNPLGALTGLTHGARLRAAAAARARLAARRRGQGGRRGAGDRARLRPRGADRLRGPARGRLRPQGVDAAGRRGAAADRGGLPERRHRRLRPAATASTTPGTRNDLGTRERS